MRLANIETLKDEPKLAMPVCTNSGKVILNAGVTLTESFLGKLKHIGIRKVYIEDDRFDDVALVEPLDFKVRNAVTLALRTTYDEVQKGTVTDEFIIKNAARDIVDFVRDSRDKGVSILSASVVDEYIIEHSINVAILTAFVGNNMSLNYEQLCDLVTGALIHDLGRENTSEEKPEHVQKGFDVMRKCRGLSLHSSIVCYEHHENFDGSGYPRKHAGSEISEFSRIIKIADYYDNALHGYECNNVPLMPHQAYENVLAVSGSLLDPAIVETFRDTIVFYPNGSTVLLSNGLKALVIRQNMGSPQRPVVRAFSDTGLLGEINLLKALTLFIKDVIVA